MSEKIALALTATVIVLLVGIYSLYQRNQTITEQAEKLEQESERLITMRGRWGR